MNNMTKAEMSSEITKLRTRVAELEAAVEAYRFALTQHPSAPYHYEPYKWTFPNGTGVWPVTTYTSNNT